MGSTMEIIPKDTQVDAGNAPTEQKATPETTEAKPVDNKAVDKTLQEILDSGKPADTKEPTVPLHIHQEVKGELKDIKREFKALKKLVEEGGSKAEVEDSLESLADEFQIDKSFLNRFVAAVKKEAKSEAKSEMDAEIRPLKEADKKAKIDKLFNEHYADAIERMPEYKTIAKPEVIKALSLLPENSNKTFVQLIEDTYGGAITGKSTIEGKKPGGGKDTAGPLDIDKARKDSAYFKEIMADPKLKAEYNAAMLSRGL